MSGKGNYLVSTALTGNLYEVTEIGKVVWLKNAGSEFNISNFNYIMTYLNNTINFRKTLIEIYKNRQTGIGAFYNTAKAVINLA
jgi:hypothetical protein